MLKHVEPEFTDMARKASYQGTVVLTGVVDDQGVPTQIKITRALGMGLEMQP